MRNLRSCALIILLPIACSVDPGSSDMGSPEPGDYVPKKATLYSEADRDGTTNGVVCSVNDKEIWIGDNSGKGQIRGAFSFDLASIPAGITVESVVLRLCQSGSEVRGSPYSTLGDMKLEHIFYGDSLNGSVLTCKALYPNDGWIVATHYTAGWKELNVTAAVQDDLSNSRPYSQYRLFHEKGSNHNGQEDQDPWYAGDSTLNPPELVITYSE